MGVVVSSEVSSSDVGTDHFVGGFFIGEASFVVGFAVGGFGSGLGVGAGFLWEEHSLPFGVGLVSLRMTFVDLQAASLTEALSVQQHGQGFFVGITLQLAFWRVFLHDRVWSVTWFR